MIPRHRRAATGVTTRGGNVPGTDPTTNPTASPRTPTTQISGGPPIPTKPFPDWSNPPLPSGPTPKTPGGYRTVAGGPIAGTTEVSVAAGWRIPILYGRCKITPDFVALDSYMGMPIFTVVISEGPIDSIEEWDYPYAATTVSLGSLSPTAGLPGWSIGLACAVITAEPNNIAIPSCIAKGRKLYDPRLGAWGSGAYPDAAKTAYSANPALVMADLRTFPQYGDLAPTAIDWDSVADAADWCDVVISGEKRYEFHLYLQAGRTADEWIDTISLHAGLTWRESAGLWRLDYADSDATVDAVVTEDHLYPGTSPSVRYGAGAGLADMPNRFTAIFQTVGGVGLKEFAEGNVVVQHPEVTAGVAPRDAAPYTFEGFKSRAMTERALTRIANEIWSEVEIDLTLNLDMLHLDVGSRFTAQLPSIGIVDVDFRVQRISYDSDSVRLTAQIFVGDIWTAPSAEDLAGPTPVGANDPTQGTLPSPPPPTPIASPMAPVVLAPPPEGLVPIYRRIAEDPAPATGEVATWDAATRTVYFAPGGGGSFILTIQNGDGSQSVTSATVLKFTGATLVDEGGGVVSITIGAEMPITVEGPGGTPSVASVTKLKFSGMTVTDEGGGVVSVSVANVSPVLAQESFAATAAQTDFVLTNAPVANGVVFVSRDGVVAKEADWSLSTATIVFGTGLAEGTEVLVGYWRTVPTGTSPRAEGFVATEGQSTFTLLHAPTVTLIVAVNGVAQAPTAWTLYSGTSLVFGTGLEAGADVWISYLY